MTTQTERRRSHRVRPGPDIRMLLPGLSASAEVRDVSSSGICCVTDRPIPVLSQVHVRLQIPASGSPPESSRELSCNGAVVRCVRNGADRHGPDSFDTAIFFTDLRETDRATLDEYVSRARSAGQVA